MFRKGTLVLAMFALVLCSATAMAGEDQKEGRTHLPGLIADGAVAVARGVAYASEAVYDGTHYALKEGACDGTRAVYDGATWAVNQTPADYGRYTWHGTSWVGVNAGKQAARTPGYAWKGFRFLTGL